jgi:hypothetical protein
MGIQKGRRPAYRRHRSDDSVTVPLGSRSQPCILVLIAFFAIIISGCGGGGGGGGATGGSLPGGGQDSGASATGGVPTPNGFTMQMQTLTSGNGSFTVSGFNSSSEVLGLVAYHSAYPDKSAAASGHDVTHGGTASSLLPDQLDITPGPPAALTVKQPPTEADKMPLDDMDFMLTRLARCLESYGVPPPVSRERLLKLGRLTDGGVVMKDFEGQTKYLYVTDATTERSQQRLFTCRYAGAHCYVYVDNADLTYFSAANAQTLGQFFDGEIWTKAEQVFGPISNLRWGGMVYLVVSSYINGNAYFDATHEYDVSGSNYVDSVYADPKLSYKGSYINITDFQGVFAHEFQHLMRWYRKVYESGYTSYNSQQLIDCVYLDAPINEGASQYFEILVGRGFTNSPSGFAKYLRIDKLRNYLYAPELNPIVSRYGSNYYAAGFMTLFYLVDHYTDGLRRLSLADGKLALDSLEQAAGESKITFFDKFALALLLSPRTGMNSAYRFTSVDLSGNTIYYDGKGLYTARFYRDNTGSSFEKGIDMSIAGYSYSMDSYRTREWAGQYHRFFNGRGNDLNLSFTDYAPHNSGGGSYRIYILKAQ